MGYVSIDLVADPLKTEDHLSEMRNTAGNV